MDKTIEELIVIPRGGMVAKKTEFENGQRWVVPGGFIISEKTFFNEYQTIEEFAAEEHNLALNGLIAEAEDESKPILFNDHYATHDVGSIVAEWIRSQAKATGEGE